MSTLFIKVKKLRNFLKICEWGKISFVVSVRSSWLETFAQVDNIFLKKEKKSESRIILKPFEVNFKFKML